MQFDSTMFFGVYFILNSWKQQFQFFGCNCNQVETKIQWMPSASHRRRPVNGQYGCGRNPKNQLVWTVCDSIHQCPIKAWKSFCFRTAVVFLDISCINIIMSWESVWSAAGVFGSKWWERANLQLRSIYSKYCSSHRWACCFCLITCMYKYQRI